MIKAIINSNGKAPASANAEITRTVTEDDGKKKTTTEVVYSESEIDRQVYRIAEEAVNGTTETEETKQWLQDNILAPVDTPEELPEEEKKDLVSSWKSVRCDTVP